MKREKRMLLYKQSRGRKGTSHSPLRDCNSDLDPAACEECAAALLHDGLQLQWTKYRSVQKACPSAAEADEQCDCLGNAMLCLRKLGLPDLAH